MAQTVNVIAPAEDRKGLLAIVGDRKRPLMPSSPLLTRKAKFGRSTARNILDGAVIERCMKPRRRQEFIRFLNAVERNAPAGKVIHAIAAEYATHKHPKILA